GFIFEGIFREPVGHLSARRLEVPEDEKLTVMDKRTKDIRRYRTQTFQLFPDRTQRDEKSVFRIEDLLVEFGLINVVQFPNFLFDFDRDQIRPVRLLDQNEKIRPVMEKGEDDVPFRRYRVLGHLAET